MRAFCDSLTMNCWSSALSLSESLERSSWGDWRVEVEERSMVGGGGWRLWLGGVGDGSRKRR